MKNIFKPFLLILIATVALWSCKKDERKVIFEGGTPPVLSETSNAPNSMVFLLGNKDVPVFNFKWTNPNYKMNTGISSQNVTYTLQFDTLGSNFSNPKLGELSYSGDLSKSLTVNDINDLLVSNTKMKLKALVPHNIQIRLKTTIGSAVPIYSNVLKYTITAYVDPNIPTLFITGSGTPDNWTNTPTDAQKFNYVSDLKFELIMHFTPGGQYKFLTKFGQWQPQYGGAPAMGGILTVRLTSTSGTDPDAINTPAAEGDYKITVDLDTKMFTIVKI